MQNPNIIQVLCSGPPWLQNPYQLSPCDSISMCKASVGSLFASGRAHLHSFTFIYISYLLSWKMLKDLIALVKMTRCVPKNTHWVIGLIPPWISLAAGWPHASDVFTTQRYSTYEKYWKGRVGPLSHNAFNSKTCQGCFAPFRSQEEGQAAKDSNSRTIAGPRQEESSRDAAYSSADFAARDRTMVPWSRRCPVIAGRAPWDL